ncbi:MAG TPA: hypothetical protein VF105_07335 [Gemmatimonadaceae bacterium]
MKRAYPLSRRSPYLALIAVLLAVVGQLGIVSASLTIARDESSAVSHTEQSGTNLHHGHNEATCASCAALSFHTTLTNAASPVHAHAVLRVVFAGATVDVVAAPYLLANSCRAPPAREV